jgi:hypothetical protein
MIVVVTKIVCEFEIEMSTVSPGLGFLFMFDFSI